jgi:hypothetical protein
LKDCRRDCKDRPGDAEQRSLPMNSATITDQA